MKAIEVSAFGGPEVLRVVDAPKPVPGPGEVLIRVEAVGLNWSDLLQRAGLYPTGPKPPFIAGQEAAGIVVAHGPGVVGAPPIGTPVVAIATGLAAEFAAVQANACVALPLPPLGGDRAVERAGLGGATDTRVVERARHGGATDTRAVERAALPVALATAYHALRTAGRAEPGETVLVHAAAGGVGTILVQVARCMGLRVIATCSPAKHDRVRALGADVACSYDDFTAARDADLAIDSVGGDVFRRTCDLMRPRGRIVVLGMASGEPPRVDATKLVFRSLEVIGFHIRHHDPRSALVACAPWLADGRVRAHVDRTLPLVEMARAHELLASRATFGKLVLTI